MDLQSIFVCLHQVVDLLFDVVSRALFLWLGICEAIFITNKHLQLISKKIIQLSEVFNNVLLIIMYKSKQLLIFLQKWLFIPQKTLNSSMHFVKILYS